MPDRRQRRQFQQINAFMRGMVIGLKRAGWSIRQIAADTHICVRPRCIDCGEDGWKMDMRQFIEMPVSQSDVSTRGSAYPFTSSGGPTCHLCLHSAKCAGHPSSFHIDQNHFPNRRQRLEWCRARSTWMTEWHRVVFSDESRFCLSSDSRRVRVWRRRGERSNSAGFVERLIARQRGIMQDNARPDTTRIIQQALHDVHMLSWPPYSPELSPIEHVWDIIGRRVHALPQSLRRRIVQMVESEWRAIPQDAIRSLIDSLPRRVAVCIAVRGYPGNFIDKHTFDPTAPRTSTIYRAICYLPYSPFSVSISRILRPYGIQVYFNSPPNLAALLRNPITKADTPNNPIHSTGAVYAVSCQDCPASYVGETGRTALERTLMLGKIEGRSKRERPEMGWLEGVKKATGPSLDELQKERGRRQEFGHFRVIDAGEPKLNHSTLFTPMAMLL
ncbi:hypothetical protein LAZ67_2002164 [Cordylochernes scorpioides]|uniref:Tc1-like transposase DDE domain-containing protein n=1 Tax=Cordylochernes scorpioides TaxID=51811 RepID=A0ABY6K1Z1_9ARAC|nr:hypothetical protein LAZ67_2002164 [Cordylochernes scorpioides]